MKRQTRTHLKRGAIWAQVKRELEESWRGTLRGMDRRCRERCRNANEQWRAVFVELQQERAVNAAMVYRIEHPWFNLYARAQVRIERMRGRKGA